MNIDYSKISPKLGSWSEDFKPFYEQGGFDEIYKKLKEEGATSKILPEGKDLFKAFEKCDKAFLKSIWLGMDPYPTIKYGTIIADGLAFSCSYTKEEQPSLKLLYNAMEEDLSEGLNLKMPRNTDLSYLAQEGVLLLNSALTVPERKSGEHKELWKPFMSYFFNNVVKDLKVPTIFFGRQAQMYATLYKGPKMSVEHPVAASYQQRAFKHEKLFSWTNETLKQQGIREINFLDIPF